MSAPGFDKAVTTFGSQAGLAIALGVTSGRVSQWRTEGVPVKHCIAIEKQSRALAAAHHDARLIVLCEELRPDIEWSVVRSNSAPDLAHH
jgi:DNA-binding transcriptional regulator YdaS (Cro superfamily)